MVYTAEHDPWCYPNSTVLKNIENIEEQEALDEFELIMFITRASEPLPTGALDHKHYLALHQHLFQDTYEWAGQHRKIRIGKGDNWFCYPEYIDDQMTKLFSSLKDEKYLDGLTDEEFAARAAHYLAELNAIHPFREGNGRTQLTFLNILCEHTERNFYDDALEPETVISAMIASFDQSLEPLTELIFEIISE